MVGGIINRIQLDVLKIQDLEDQMKAKPLSRIICSPTRASQKHFFPNNLDFCADGISNSKPVKRMNMRMGASVNSLSSIKGFPIVNQYVKEHFWSYEVLQSLN